jgi:hypothetical protein
MGNAFTIYTGNNQFTIITNVDGYAFALVGLTSQITFTTHNSWEASSEGTSDSKYNYIFRYKPSGVRTSETFASPGSWVFTLDSGTIPVDTVVHWVNGTTASYDGDENSSTPFSAVIYNIEASTTDAGSGGGDPHIIPLYNPENVIYVLPTDNKIYKYFDNRDEEERIVVNTKMWVLDNRFIYIIDKLKEMNSKYYEEAKERVHEFIVDDCHTEIDTSFAKYISFMVKTKNYMDMIVLDTENLMPVNCINDLNINKLYNYEANYIDFNKAISNFKKLEVSEIMPYKKNIMNIDKIISNENEGDVYCREIKINSKKHGMLIFNVIRIPSRINHRNHIEIRVIEPNKVNPYNCCGTLIKINQCEQVPTLLHINNEPNKLFMYDEKKQGKILNTKEWRLRRSQIVTKERHRCKKIIRRTGKGDLDFYSLVNTNPEKEYLKMIEENK